jgi:hypothetical protein
MRDDLLSTAGRLLYRQLPEEYRYRDGPSDPDELADLEAYLHGFGAFLDLARGTLEQLYADSFAEPADNGRTIQSWLVPYLAELTGAELASPDATARVQELDSSVAWYQGKGTLGTIDAIADVVTAAETITVEGWTRTLATPRLGLPPFSTPAAAIGDGDALGPAALPLGTPDLRHTNRAVIDPAGRNPIMAFRLPTRDADGLAAPPRLVFWRPRARTGAPCFPGHFDDTATRTPDVRDPDHFDVGPHPKRIRIHVQPPTGFFAPGLLRLTAAGADPLGLAAADTSIDPTAAIAALKPGAPVPDRLEIEGDLAIPAGRAITFKDVLLLGTVTVEAGASLRLERAAARRIVLPADITPTLTATDSLIDTIDGADGGARLEFTTVLGAVALKRLQASDCIFAGTLDPAVCDAPETCIRYSRLPQALAETGTCLAHAPHNTGDAALFLPRAIGEPGACEVREPVFGEPGAGVLDHRTSIRIREGSERGGEMGAYHHRAHAASLRALQQKLGDFLPLGQELVIAYDERLAVLPPAEA